MKQDIIKAISICAAYLASSAATFAGFQRELVARIKKERLLSKELIRIALGDRNIASDKYKCPIKRLV